MDAIEHLALFLVQYWGGPQEYQELRGHPRLRRRHAAFVIGEQERAAWFEHMEAAVRGGGLTDEDEEELLAYFAMAAASLVNHV